MRVAHQAAGTLPKERVQRHLRHPIHPGARFPFTPTKPALPRTLRRFAQLLNITRHPMIQTSIAFHRRKPVLHIQFQALQYGSQVRRDRPGLVRVNGCLRCIISSPSSGSAGVNGAPTVAPLTAKARPATTVRTTRLGFYRNPARVRKKAAAAARGMAMAVRRQKMKTRW